MFDVAVIGGGPSGSVASLVLARAGRKVLLVDRGKKAARQIGESLPGAARPLLRHLGLLTLVEDGQHLVSVGNCSAWGSETLETTDSVRDPQGPGWHLDRVRFDEDLRLAAQSAGVQLKEVAVSSVTSGGTGWLVRSEGFEAHSKWLVNATGRGTLVSRSLGARRLRDDDLVAVYAWVPTSRRDGEARTLVETAADGWWYTSRLPDRSRVLVFHTRPEMARQLLKSPTDFRRRISETTHLRKLVAGRSRLPLRLACTEACGTMLDSVSGPGWIAAGDAAMAFDPLSSQGIFNALYSGMKAGQTIDRALEGDTGAVPAYRARLDEIRTTYLARRRLYYSMERRWLENPFWKGLSHGT